MKFRVPTIKDQAQFDTNASHPLQSWAWGEFRQTTGVIVERLFNSNTSLQITFHPLPKTPFTIGYLPKSTIPNQEILSALRQLGRKHNAIFIKLEPNVSAPESDKKDSLITLRKFLLKNGCLLGRPMFTNFSFQLDLTKTEDILFQNLKSKTRYNVRLAQKNGVTVSIDNSDQAFNDYLKLWKETTKRQNFYSHNKAYHRSMWKILRKAKIAHLLKADYQNDTLASWILFTFNNILYYPYGTSSTKHRELMASNLIMWEAIRFGIGQNCTQFDMWGSLGPKPDKSDPWYGFHRFKQGYGGDLVEFVGSYDLVLKPILYPFFRTAESIRWWLLRNKNR